MSKLQEISGELIEISSTSPDLRNNALSNLAKKIQGLDDYDIIPEQKSLIVSIIESLIAENDAEQIAKSKLVFVPDVEEQIAPTKKTRAKKGTKPVSTPVDESTLEDLPDFIDKDMLITDLPEQVKKLVILRNSEQTGKTFIESSFIFDLKDTIQFAFNWNDTPEGVDFWSEINNNGDLREFKKLYGNKGEKVDEIIEFSELTEFVEGLSENETELPDTIEKQLKIKDLPNAVKKLALLRQIEQNLTPQSDVFLSSYLAFDWAETPEERQFWNMISDGDLTEFKKLYGNKGEKVDEIINLSIAKSKTPAPAPAPVVKTRKPRTPKAPAPAPVITTQEVNAVELIIYLAKGRVNIKTLSLYELLDTSKFIISKFQRVELKLNFNVITDLGTYLSKILINVDDSTDDLIRKLVEQFDTFVRPKLNWKNFDERQGDIIRMELNEEIVNDAFEVKAPKVAKPKPVAKPKTTSVKPEAKTNKKQVTKPKAKSDLSFLDDLDNIL